MKKFILWASLVMLLFTGCNMQTQNLEEEKYVKIFIATRLRSDFSFTVKYNNKDSITLNLTCPEGNFERGYTEKIPLEKFDEKIFNEELTRIQNEFFTKESMTIYHGDSVDGMGNTIDENLYILRFYEL